jgi:hypothetical protein
VSLPSLISQSASLFAQRSGPTHRLSGYCSHFEENPFPENRVHETDNNNNITAISDVAVTVLLLTMVKLFYGYLS